VSGRFVAQAAPAKQTIVKAKISIPARFRSDGFISSPSIVFIIGHTFTVPRSVYYIFSIADTTPSPNQGTVQSEAADVGRPKDENRFT
jgi:hypothetical protein